MYELGRSLGMMSGILVGIVVAVILVIVLNKNHKLKCDYDERQEQIHGKGYKYGFYTVVIYEAIMMCLSVGGFFEIVSVEQAVFHALSIFLGITVYCSHAISNGAYWARNNSIKRYAILMIILFVVNLMPVIATLTSGVQIVDGYIDFPFVNLFCSLMIAVLAIVWGIRSALDSKAERED